MFENYSYKALQEELRKLKDIKSVITNMERPKNFTYIDVLNLHEYIDMLIKHAELMLKEKQVD